MRKIVILLSVLLTTGCTTSVDSVMKSRGKIVFSIRLTKGAFSGVEKGDTGIFFYREDEKFPTGSLGLVTGAKLKHGRLVDFFGGSTVESNEMLQQIEKIGFEPFDFEAELKRVDAILAEEAKRTGVQHMTSFALDGAEYEIKFTYGTVDFTLKQWNPTVTIDSYAPYSSKIAKLKAVIDCFALSYGRSKFEL